MILQVSEASEPMRQVGDDLQISSRKHIGPNFTLKPRTKASSLQFFKTEIKTDLGGKRNKISDGYMSYLSTQETQTQELVYRNESFEVPTVSSRFIFVFALSQLRGPDHL